MKNTTTAVKANKTVMVLLILGLSTIIFPLYMTIIIAFKQPPCLRPGALIISGKRWK